MKRAYARNNEGAALLLALGFFIAMAILVAALTQRVQSQVNQVVTYSEFDHALQGVEAGLSMARAEINGFLGTNDEDQDGRVGVDPQMDISSSQPWFDDDQVTPQSMSTMTDVEYIAYAYDWGADGVDNNGDAAIDEAAEAGYYTVYSLARTDGGTTRRAEVILDSVPLNIWRNALFAGAGQTTGTLINGNVSVHGSVHLLGDNLDDGDLAVAALDLSGTSLIHNNYEGIPAALAARIPSLPTTEFDGETVETLNAQLLVRNGLVGLSGNSEVGQTHQTGNSFKETMDGVYVTDGWTGNGLDANGDPINVYSDNGFDEAYNLSSQFELPTYDNDGGRNHLQYYLEPDSNPLAGFQQVYTGDMQIEADKNFYWNSTLGVAVANEDIGVNGMPAVADLDPTQHYLWFDADTNTMVINGRVAVDGDVIIDRGGGGDKTINYTGKGSILSYDADGSGDGGSVSVETDLLTVNADGSTADSFPANNALALMAEDDMYIGINSQLELMGGFYAQDEIRMDKQSTLIGTIVGNSFDLGSNVPDIYQVPTLVDGWEPWMRVIGAEDILYYTPMSWRELGVL